MSQSHKSRVAILALFLFANACAAGTARPEPGLPNPSPADGSSIRARTGAPRPWREEPIAIRELPDGAPTVNIEIAPSAMARLDADLFNAADEQGAFHDGAGNVYTNVDVSYRGAYALRGLARRPGHLRNWKVKFAKDRKYNGRREWNFNFEPDFSQKLALDLLKFNGVKVPSAQHVILKVNGVYQGMYLQYEDPDNDAWLWDSFGDATGDLYKGARDLPEGPRYFADFTILGPNDSDYFHHYNKKSGPLTAPDDYHVIREFIEQLNTVPDAEFENWLETHFDVDSFLSYLVIVNFTLNWDSYPRRPKNLWIYENRRKNVMVFIPWDLNASFRAGQSRHNRAGRAASVFLFFQLPRPAPRIPEEGYKRPLADRMMARRRYRAAYVANYRQATAAILNEPYLSDRIDKLTAIIYNKLSYAHRNRLLDANRSTKEFIAERCRHVARELAKLR